MAKNRETVPATDSVESIEQAAAELTPKQEAAVEGVTPAGTTDHLAEQEAQLADLQPDVGQSVLYKLPTGPHKGQLRHAIVTLNNEDGTSNLNVSCGSPMDLSVFPVCAVESVANGAGLGQWVFMYETPINVVRHQ